MKSGQLLERPMNKDSAGENSDAVGRCAGRVSGRWRRTALIGLVLGVIVSVGWMGLRSAGYRRLRAYEAALRTHGEKLAWAELERDKTDASTESRLNLETVSAELRTRGMNPGALDLMKFIGPGRAQVAWKMDAPPLVRGGGAMDWTEFDQTLVFAAEQIARVRKSLQDPPAFWSPPQSNFSLVIPDYVSIRVAAQWLAGDLVNHLHHRRLEPALQDLEAMAHCAQVNREEFSLVAQLVRVAVANLGLSATWEALQAPGWSEPQLERMQHAWEPLDLIGAVEKGFIGVRAQNLSVWDAARHSSGRRMRAALQLNMATNFVLRDFLGDYVLFPAYKLTSMDEDELFCLRAVQGSIEAIRGIKQGRPWKASADPLNEAVQALARMPAKEKALHHWLGALALPNFVRAVETATHTETLRELTITVIGLKRFDLQHGYLPRNLAELAPSVLNRGSYDPMSGKPLEYFVRDHGRFRLYSVGTNGTDDAGETPFWYQGRQSLWDPPDAVWPDPSDPE